MCSLVLPNEKTVEQKKWRKTAEKEHHIFMTAAVPRESWKNTGCFSHIIDLINEKEPLNKILA